MTNYWVVYRPLHFFVRMRLTLDKPLNSLILEGALGQPPNCPLTQRFRVPLLQSGSRKFKSYMGNQWENDEIGKHRRLKISRQLWLEGSSPSSPTMPY